MGAFWENGPASPMVMPSACSTFSMFASPYSFYQATKVISKLTRVSLAPAVDRQPELGRRGGNLSPGTQPANRHAVGLLGISNVYFKMLTARSPYKIYFTFPSQKSVSLEYEPSWQPLHISAK